MAKLYI